jgi:hypothetical protein
MPCYCDTPDESDQAEIENRAKTGMYFFAQSLLTLEQAKECEKRGLKQFPIDDVNSHLCKICKVLTKEQMEGISANYYQIRWPHKTLYDWHLRHCKDDEAHQ